MAKKQKNRQRKEKARVELLIMHTFPIEKEAHRCVGMLRKAGVKASVNPKDFGRDRSLVYFKGRVSVYVLKRDSKKALRVFRKYTIEAEKRGVITLPTQEGTLVNLDMLIHDCRQYLMLATGEIKSIEHQGILELDDPTCDVRKITIRLKRLKDQCMRMANREPLDWQHRGGLGE